MTTKRERLNAQLDRYAEDFRLLYDKQHDLANDLVQLDSSYRKLIAHAGFVEQLISSSRDLHLVTDEFGTVLSANSAAGVIAASASLAGCRLEKWISTDSLRSYRNLLAKMSDRQARSSGEWLLKLSPQNNREKNLFVSVRVFPLPQHEDIRFPLGQNSCRFDRILN